MADSVEVNFLSLPIPKAAGAQRSSNRTRPTYIGEIPAEVRTGGSEGGSPVTAAGMAYTTICGPFLDDEDFMYTKPPRPCSKTSTFIVNASANFKQTKLATCTRACPYRFTPARPNTSRKRASPPRAGAPKSKARRFPAGKRRQRPRPDTATPPSPRGVSPWIK